MSGHEFSAERAAKGEPVQFCSTGGHWLDVHYVGPDRVRGGHFVQFDDGSHVSTSALRMKPMPVKKWVMEFDTSYEAYAAAHILSHGLVREEGLTVPQIKEVEIKP